METSNGVDPYEFCVEKAREAGELALSQRGKELEVMEKGGDPKDVVTNVDLAVNRTLLTAIREAFPDDRIYSEESGGAQSAERLWVIDPIDGSANFSRGIPHFATCIGLLERGVPTAGAVYNPVTRELFSFSRGKGAFLNGEPIKVSSVTELKSAHVFLHAGRKESVRDWGGESYRRLLGAAKKTNNFASTALDTCFVAAGRIEASIHGTMSTLDIAAAIGILREAGGVLSDALGGEVALSKEPQRVYTANNPDMLEHVRTLLET